MIHPIKALNNLILKNFIKDTIESLPNLKEKGLQYLKEHKEEILESVKKEIIHIIKQYIDNKTKSSKGE